MDKISLVTALNNIIRENELSLDLYFVYKNGDTYVQYIVDPNEELRTELLEEFTEILKRYTVENNPYELNDIYDDNEFEDYHLFYDEIAKNDVANKVFNFDRAEVLDYTQDVGSFSKIYGFLIEICNGEDNVTIYKRNQPTNAINPKKVINFISGTENKLKLIEQNAIYINKTVDLFKINHYVYINSRTVYEVQFGFIAELKAKAETGYIDLIGTGAFEFEEGLQDKIRKFPKAELKKLSSVSKNNPIIKNKKWKSVIRQAKKYAKHQFTTNEDGLIKITSQKELKILIKILNRDYNFNEASKELYYTKNKQLIKK
ncbi:MAG: Kiwa anti-phage protein KwaB-like domain-containing protein [Lishizhenia sp.]